MGRNGMGKTTTVRAIMGQLPLTSGRISRFGDDRSDQAIIRYRAFRYWASCQRVGRFFQT